MRTFGGLCCLLWVVGICPPSHAVPRGTTDGTRTQQLLPKAKKIALVIGINRYRNSHWGTLSFAVRDADRFGRMMQRGGFTHILKLNASAGTTLAQIKGALSRLKQLNRSPQDTVVIYISAHGTLLDLRGQSRSRRFIITTDTDDENVVGTGLQVEWLRRQLKSFVSQRKALILATCHSQKKGSKSKKVRGQKGLLKAALMPNSTTMLILNAASYRYSAYESKRLKSDVYTHFLLQCIQKLQKKRGAHGRVSALEAHSCSVRKTYRYVLKHRGVHQVPGLVADVRGLNSVYLVGRSNPKTRFVKANGNASSLAAKGDPPVVQIPSRLLETHRIQIYQKQGKSRKKVQNIDLRGELVASLAPGRYTFAFIHRKTAQVQQRELVLRPSQREYLQLPEAFQRHTFALLGGLSQVGAHPFRATHPFVGLGYRWQPRRWFFLGTALGYHLGQLPQSSAQFLYHRLALLRLEGGLVPLVHKHFRASAGLYGQLGMDITHRSQRYHFSPAGGLGTLVDIEIWLLPSLGLRLGGEIGVDLALAGTQSPQLSPSLAWKIRGALLFAL